MAAGWCALFGLLYLATGNTAFSGMAAVPAVPAALAKVRQPLSSLAVSGFLTFLLSARWLAHSLAPGLGLELGVPGAAVHNHEWHRCAATSDVFARVPLVRLACAGDF